MREDLDKKLCEDFPILFQNRNKSSQVTAMCRGFPGDGWHDLIREASEKLEKINNEELRDSEFKIVASQVKEKFGTLRFYTDHVGSSEEIWKRMQDITSEAENRSEVTCESCGKEGKRRTGGWIKTLCDECEREREEEVERRKNKEE